MMRRLRQGTIGAVLLLAAVEAVEAGEVRGVTLFKSNDGRQQVIGARVTGPAKEHVFVTQDGIRYDLGPIGEGGAASVTVVNQDGRPPVIVVAPESGNR